MNPTRPSFRRLAALIATLALLATPLGGSSAHAAPSRAKAQCGPTKVASHKTATTVAPENTVAGINAVPAQGAGVVELDVQWTSSGFPVLMHDATVNRTTNGTGEPSTLSLSAITALSAVDDPATTWKTDPRYKDVKVPYGWDFMNAAQANNLDVLVDVHAEPTQLGMEKLVNYMDRWSYRTRTTIMSTSARIQAMKSWYPGLNYALIEYPPNGRSYTPSYLKSIGAGAYVIPVQSLSQLGGADFVQYMHAQGVKVFVWTSDSAALDSISGWAKVFDVQADMLITNDPAGALAQCL